MSEQQRTPLIPDCKLLKQALCGLTGNFHLNFWTYLYSKYSCSANHKGLCVYVCVHTYIHTYATVQKFWDKKFFVFFQQGHIKSNSKDINATKDLYFKCWSFELEILQTPNLWTVVFKYINMSYINIHIINLRKEAHFLSVASLYHQESPALPFFFSILMSCFSQKCIWDT